MGSALRMALARLARVESGRYAVCHVHGACLEDSVIFESVVSWSMALDASELARQLAARRKPKHVICPVCGAAAVGLGRRTYCSDRCAKRAWWRRHRAKASDVAADATALRVWEDDGGAAEPVS